MHKFDKSILITILYWHCFLLILLPLSLLEQFLSSLGLLDYKKSEKYELEKQYVCFIILKIQISPV